MDVNPTFAVGMSRIPAHGYFIRANFGGPKFWPFACSQYVLMSPDDTNVYGTRGVEFGDMVGVGD